MKSVKSDVNKKVRYIRFIRCLFSFCSQNYKKSLKSTGHTKNTAYQWERVSGVKILFISQRIVPTNHLSKHFNGTRLHLLYNVIGQAALHFFALRSTGF